MKNISVEEKVKEILVDKLVLSLDDISNHDNLENDLMADDLDVIDIVMELEDFYDIEIRDDVVTNIETVQDLVNCVQDLVDDDE